MTLNELMAESDHEVYFCVVTPDGEEHIFLSSDYHGAHPDVMNADKVPMLWVPVVPSENKESDEEDE